MIIYSFNLAKIGVKAVNGEVAVVDAINPGEAAQGEGRQRERKGAQEGAAVPPRPQKVLFPLYLLHLFRITLCSHRLCELKASRMLHFLFLPIGSFSS